MDQKKLDERKCLDVAIRQCLSQHGLSKKIGQLMDGDDMVRTRDEEPDFLRKPKCLQQKGAKVIGIEHFRVNKLSKETAEEKVISRGAILEQEMQQTFELGHNEVTKGNSVSDETVAKLFDTVAQNAEMQLNANYATYMQSFKYAFKKHLKKVDKYHKKMKKDTAGKFDCDLIFLLEIYAPFPELTFRNSQKQKSDMYALPIFEDMIKWIEENCLSSKIKYIVFVFYKDLLKQSAITTAVSVKNIRSDLKKQNIPIYTYLWYPGSFYRALQTNGPADVKCTVERIGESYDTTFAINNSKLPENVCAEFVKKTIPRILNCEKQKIPYASGKTIIQAMLDFNLLQNK